MSWSSPFRTLLLVMGFLKETFQRKRNGMDELNLPVPAAGLKVANDFCLPLPLPNAKSPHYG